MHAYPADLAALVRRRWNRLLGGESFFDLPVYREWDPLPRPAVLSRLLSTCYQASLLREEDRAVRFRLMVCEPATLPAGVSPPDGLHPLVFEESRLVSPNELRRLAAAAAFERALVGVRAGADGRFEIWGLVHSGDQWLHTLEGSRRSFQPLPPCLVVSATGPGNLTVAKGSLAVARLLAGQLVKPTPSVLEVTTLTRGDEAVNRIFLDAHEREQRQRNGSWARLDGTLVNQMRRQAALRVLAAMRRLRHGGTLIILPLPLVAQTRRWKPMLNLKHAFPPGAPRRQLFMLLTRLLAALAEDCGKRFGPRHRVTWRDYLSSTDPAVRHADEAINETVRFLACLSAVDGAVVLGQPLELLGFGAEISGSLSSVEQVARALNPSSTRTELEHTLNVGTRHRSAYRLCQALPGVVAAVISQDGSMRIVKRAGRRVVYSEHLATGVLDI